MRKTMSIQWLARMHALTLLHSGFPHTERENNNNKTWKCFIQAKRPLHSCKRSAFLSLSVCVCARFLLVFSCSFLLCRVNYGPPSKYFLCYYFTLGYTFAPLLKQTKFFSRSHVFIPHFMCDELVCLCECVSLYVVLFCFSPWMVPAILSFTAFFRYFHILCECVCVCLYTACNAQPWEK